MTERFQRELVDRREASLWYLAQKPGETLGPGFYAHDILMDQNDDLFVSETNLKLVTLPMMRKLLPIADDLPSHR